MRWVTDRQGRLVWVCSEWENFAGFSLREIEGVRGDAVILPAERARIMTAGAVAVAALREFDCAFSHVSHGAHVPVVTHARPITEHGVWRGYHGWTERVLSPRPWGQIDETTRHKIISALTALR